MALRTELEQYQQLRALLPPGPAWNPARAPEIDAYLQALASELSRLDARAGGLLNEFDPLTLHELLPDWERVMSLPDPCLGASPSVEDRKIAVRHRLVGLGGQAPAFFVQIAIDQGYPNAQVVEHRAPRFGRARFGNAQFGTWSAQFMWTLYAGSRLRGGRRWGAAVWGERFGANPAESLECLIRRAAPAHTVETIVYEEAP